MVYQFFTQVYQFYDVIFIFRVQSFSLHQELALSDCFSLNRSIQAYCIKLRARRRFLAKRDDINLGAKNCQNRKLSQTKPAFGRPLEVFYVLLKVSKRHL